MLFLVLFNLYANESENVILRDEFQRLIQVSECIFVPEHVQFLFSEVSYICFPHLNNKLLLMLYIFSKTVSIMMILDPG